MAVTPSKLNLGVVGIDFFDREPQTLGKSDERSTLQIEQKESFRWLEGYRLACQLAAESPGTQIVSVADRETDIYDIFVDSQQQSGPRAEFIIRAKVAQSTPERDPAAGKAAYRKVRDEVGAAELLTTRTIELSVTPKRKARTAQLEIRAITVTVKPPHERSYLPPATLNVVLAKEVGGPGDGTDVSWLLLTSMPIGTIEEILMVIDYYVVRLAVELLFKRWKSQGLAAKLSGSTEVRQLVRVWARLLAALVQHWLVLAVSWGDPTQSGERYARRSDTSSAA